MPCSEHSSVTPHLDEAELEGGAGELLRQDVQATVALQLPRLVRQQDGVVKRIRQRPCWDGWLCLHLLLQRRILCKP